MEINMTIAAAIFMLLIALADQLVKLWAIGSLRGQPPREFIKLFGTKIIDLCYVENNGAIFGIMKGVRPLLIALPIILSGVIFWGILKKRIVRPVQIFCGAAIAGGGLGNLIDRIFRGGWVVDYLDVQLFDFAVFNLADCFVTVGVILFSIDFLFFDKTDTVFGKTVKKTQAASDDDGEKENEQ